MMQVAAKYTALFLRYESLKTISLKVKLRVYRKSVIPVYIYNRSTDERVPLPMIKIPLISTFTVLHCNIFLAFKIITTFCSPLRREREKREKVYSPRYNNTAVKLTASKWINSLHLGMAS